MVIYLSICLSACLSEHYFHGMDKVVSCCTSLTSNPLPVKLVTGQTTEADGPLSSP